MSDFESRLACVIGADGTIYFGSGDTNFYALIPREDHAEVKWMKNLATTDFSTAAVRTDGAIVVGTGTGQVLAISTIWLPMR